MTAGAVTQQNPVLPAHPLQARRRMVELFEPHPSDADLQDRLAAGDLLGVFVDVETTGLDPDRDKIIELAVVPFAFSPNGRISAAGKSFSSLEDPGVPIPPAMTKIHGIADSDVAGKRIDDAAVNELVANAAIVVAHNASFDRRFLEERLPVFRSLRWGCSMADVPWQEEGFAGTKLEWLLFKHCWMFYEGHRADIDCYVALHLLSTMLPSGVRTFACVLDAARKKWVRLWAIKAPFDSKGVLKLRGYHWNDGENGQPKAWWIELPFEDAGKEREWLAIEVYRGRDTGIRADSFDARMRFSARVGKG